MTFHAEHLHHCILVAYIKRHNQNLVEHLRWGLLVVNYFRKKLHLRCSTEFWTHFWYTCISFKVCCYLHSQNVFNTKSRHVSKNCCRLDGIVNRPNISKNISNNFLLILGVIFLVPSQCSFPKLKLHVTRKYETIFAPFCFYLHQLKMHLSDF